jgi:ribosome modulation factor
MPDSTSEAAWAAGFQAGTERRALLSNPFPAGTAEFRTWQAGWRAAERQGRPGDEPPPTTTP